MARTDNLRKQHAEILSLAREINQNLGDAMTGEQITLVRKQLSKMYGLVGLHLAMEDKSLYPSLLQSKDVAAKELAKQYMTEMGDLSAAFASYMQTWNTSVVVSAKPSEFTAETRAIFNALSKRIHRENTQLYPVADAIP